MKNLEKLLKTETTKRTPTVIKKTLCSVSKNVFILDIIPIIQAWASKGSTATIAFDSIEVMISQISPVLFESISYSGSGCNGAQSSLSPDKKVFVSSFPAFFATVEGNTPNVAFSYCKMSIRLNTNGLKKNEKFTITININGQALLDNESCANVFENYKRIITLKGPYSNNYSASFTIEYNVSGCEFHCF